MGWFSEYTGGFLTEPLFEGGVGDGAAVVEGGFGVWYGTERHFEKVLVESMVF
jgi:hypothetical protein